MQSRNLVIIMLTFALSIVLVLTPRPAASHCDTMDGPVVMDARHALEKGDVTTVLKWVKKEHEPEIRALFERTLALRAKDAQVREFADLYFFETLVRIHRAGEGAPYTGLKPADTEVEAGIEAADQALEAGSVETLTQQISKDVSAAIQTRFERVIEARKNADKTVDAGREYVEAYVTFIHYVERLQEDIAQAPAHQMATPQSEHIH